MTFTYTGSSETYGTVISADNKCWLDRNLGATQVATSSTDAASYGDLFQWGRLDDSHQVRTSPTTTTLSNSDIPGHGNFIKVWVTQPTGDLRKTPIYGKELMEQTSLSRWVSAAYAGRMGHRAPELEHQQRCRGFCVIA